MGKRAQIWIETVLYTLIGLALIGIVLAIITPRINEGRDRNVVEQSIGALNDFDGKMLEVIESGGGNVRTLDAFSLKRGEFYVKAQDTTSLNNSIAIVLEDLSSAYSEVGVDIRYGRVKILTEKNGRYYKTTLWINYDFDLRYENTNIEKKLTAASIPYRFSIENVDGASDYINVEEISGR